MPVISPSDPDAVMTLFREAATEAGRIAQGFFRPGGRTTAHIDYKDGGSPVSDADFAADQYLHETLCAALPEAAWLSEESAASPDRLERRHVLVVDPIDGTRGFVAGDARWAVCIALVTDGHPVVGVVHAPVLDQSFAAVLGGGAFCNGLPIVTSTRTDLNEAVIAAPANLSQLATRPITFRIAAKIPSLACRLAHVAAGFLDGCVAAANANDWDIAAADLILHEAGAVLTDRLGAPPVYNRAKPVHPALIAAPPALHEQLVGLLSRPGD